MTHAGQHPISRRNSALALLFALAGLVWLLGVGRAERSSMLGPAAENLALTAAFDPVYVPIVALFGAHVLLALFTLMRPVWSPAVSVARIVIHAGGLLVATMLLFAGDLVAAAADPAIRDTAAVGRLVETVNNGCDIGLAVLAVAKLVQIGVEALVMRSRW